MTTKILVAFGTRPEAVKLAPVIRALREASDRFATVVVFTSQHRDLASSIIEYFDIRPDYNLDVMTMAQSPSEVTARVLGAIEGVYMRESPDLVLVQGDTTTAMASALGAFYRKIPAAHVEAGLRTGSIYNPFPEEMNRRLIGTLASLHLAATDANRDALLHENVAAETIHVTGNPVIDALRMILDDKGRSVPPAIASEIIARGNRIVLLTTHRRENFGEPQREIFHAVSTIVEQHPSIEIIFPVHPNPVVAEAIRSDLPPHPRIHLIEPLDYPPFIHLLSMSHLVLTDSGGLQEEAPALGVPVLILRTTTEREEVITAGSGRLVGVRKDAIIAAVDELLNDNEVYARMAVRRYPFGEGGAAGKILQILDFGF